MIEFPKIETLWNRNKETFIVEEGDFRCPEFGLVRPERWIFQEKIDGTNIRIGWNGKERVIQGRTDKAQLAGDLITNIQSSVTPEKLAEVFPEVNSEEGVVLFGEGYGPGIQKDGGKYRSDKGFILFDVRVGHWWLEMPDVAAIGNSLGVRIAPIYNMDLEVIVSHLKADNLLSLESTHEHKAEGVVLRTNPTLLFRSAQRCIAKLKAVDFQSGHGPKPKEK